MSLFKEGDLNTETAMNRTSEAVFRAVDEFLKTIKGTSEASVLIALIKSSLAKAGIDDQAINDFLIKHFPYQNLDTQCESPHE